MNTIEILKEVYGYATPIFLKDVRIGGKTKVSIRKELSRAVAAGVMVRESNGIYSFREDTDIPRGVSFEDIVEKKFIKDDFGVPGLNINVYGYYTGQTFLNMIGISQQVPAIVEIATNNTSCIRKYCAKGYTALLRKPRVSVDHTNYKILQFLDMFCYLSLEDVIKNKKLINEYAKENITFRDFEQYISKYPPRIARMIFDGGIYYALRQ